MFGHVPCGKAKKNKNLQVGTSMPSMPPVSGGMVCGGLSVHHLGRPMADMGEIPGAWLKVQYGTPKSAG
jgi:hypothetical protein